MSDSAVTRPDTVALYVTCLVDLFRPGVGMAAVDLLERAGYRVEVPDGQTCCGQPAWNSGDEAQARELARRAIRQLQGYAHVVVPSGSCAGTMVCHYPTLFADEPEWLDAARDLTGRTWELTRFLVDVAGLPADSLGPCQGIATYHDACSGLRQLGIREQPRKLLGAVQGLSLREMEDTDTCCGFGGTFCVKYPEISERMVSNKVERVRESGADMLLGGDLGCLMNIAGRMQRLGVPTRAYHVAEVLAGTADGPAIGEKER
ncbi:MAG: (Fe-S)-binding protein [Ectothiorhodospiraceae bacterium]|nr:(Fe-S)-binding protein [Ectothiorhodospiraceae bacterium]